jgi:short-subunit dehydrogenase
MAMRLAVELAHVRVNCVSPGIVDTSLWNWALPDNKPTEYKHYEEKSPTKSVGYPNDSAEAYGYCIRCKHVTMSLGRRSLLMEVQLWYEYQKIVHTRGQMRRDGCTEFDFQLE